MAPASGELARPRQASIPEVYNVMGTHNPNQRWLWYLKPDRRAAMKIKVFSWNFVSSFLALLVSTYFSGNVFGQAEVSAVGVPYA